MAGALRLAVCSRCMVVYTDMATSPSRTFFVCREFEHNGNAAAARLLMQRGLRACKDNSRLWSEYLNMVCHVNGTEAQQKQQQVPEHSISTAAPGGTHLSSEHDGQILLNPNRPAHPVDKQAHKLWNYMHVCRR